MWADGDRRGLGQQLAGANAAAKWLPNGRDAFASPTSVAGYASIYMPQFDAEQLRRRQVGFRHRCHTQHGIGQPAVATSAYALLAFCIRTAWDSLQDPPPLPEYASQRLSEELEAPFEPIEQKLSDIPPSMSALALSV